jgi:hypothetical protein
VSEVLHTRSALHGVAIPGRYGKLDGAPGVTISERIDIGLATVAARKGKTEALAAAVRAAYGVGQEEKTTSASAIQPRPAVISSAHIGV